MFAGEDAGGVKRRERSGRRRRAPRVDVVDHLADARREPRVERVHQREVLRARAVEFAEGLQDREAHERVLVVERPPEVLEVVVGEEKQRVLEHPPTDAPHARDPNRGVHVPEPVREDLAKRALDHRLRGVDLGLGHREGFPQPPRHARVGARFSRLGVQLALREIPRVRLRPRDADERRDELQTRLGGGDAHRPRADAREERDEVG